MISTVPVLLPGFDTSGSFVQFAPKSVTGFLSGSVTVTESLAAGTLFKSVVKPSVAFASFLSASLGTTLTVTSTVSVPSGYVTFTFPVALPVLEVSGACSQVRVVPFGKSTCLPSLFLATTVPAGTSFNSTPRGTSGTLPAWASYCSVSLLTCTVTPDTSSLEPSG